MTAPAATDSPDIRDAVRAAGESALARKAWRPLFP
jgi:hypothetical protein